MVEDRNRLKLKVLTLYAMFLKQEKLSEQSAIFLWLKLKNLSRSTDNKAFYYNVFCFLRGFFYKHPVLRFHYIKHVKSQLRASYLMPEYNRALLLKLELLKQNNFVQVFKNNWFLYYPYEFNFYVLPYRNYFIRLDIFSFFFLWSSLENLRTVLYNHYIMSIETLWKRPVIRRALIHRWYERKLIHLHLGDNKKKHYNYRPVRINERLNAAFFVMFFWKNRYALYNFVFARKHSYNLMLSSKSHLMAQINRKLDQLFALSNTVTSIDEKDIVDADIVEKGDYMLEGSFFTNWSLQMITLKLYIFLMRSGKRLSFYHWEIARYHKYFIHIVRRRGWSGVSWYVNRLLHIRYRSFFKRFFNKIWLSKNFLNHFMLQDFYSYSHKTINQMIHFLDSRYYYKILHLKLNRLFKFNITYLTSNDLQLWHAYIRPFQGFSYLKGKRIKLPNIRIRKMMKRKFTIEVRQQYLFNFAKEYMMSYLTVPVYYTYSVVGLEYYYWRIFSINSKEKWLDSRLHYYYYFIKLDVDTLISSRYQSFSRFFVERANEPDMRLWYTDTLEKKDVWPKVVYPVAKPMIDPWMIMHFDAYRDFFTLAFHQSIKLSVLFFFLTEEFNLMSYHKYYFHELAKGRLDLILRLNECFNMYVCVNEKAFSNLKPDFYRKRRTKTPWVAPLTEKEKLLSPDEIGMRYAQGFQWKLNKLPAWMEKKSRVKTRTFKSSSIIRPDIW